MKKVLFMTFALLGSVGLAQSFPVKVVHSNGNTESINFIPTPKAKKAWRIGVVVPNTEKYWIATNYGLIEEAKRLGVQVKYLAGKSYSDIEGQNRLISQLVREKVDLLLIAPASSGDQNAFIEKVIKEDKVPVIGFVNPLSTTLVVSRCQVSYYETAQKSAEYLAKISKGKNAVVGLVPGPTRTGWAEDIYNGFTASLKEHRNIKVASTLWGEMTPESQAQILNRLFQRVPNMNYLVTNTVGAEVAYPMIARMNKSRNVKIITTYADPSVVKGIQDGQILMAPDDMPARLGRLGINMAVDYLEGRRVPAVMGPVIRELTADNIRKIDLVSSFGPVNYKPVMQWNWR